MHLNPSAPAVKEFLLGCFELKEGKSNMNGNPQKQIVKGDNFRLRK